MLKQLEEHPLEQVEVQLPSQPPPQEFPQPPLQFWEHTVVQLPVQLLASQANLQVPLQPELLPTQPQADHHPPLHPP